MVIVLLEQVGRGDIRPGKHPMLLWISRAMSHATSASGRNTWPGPELGGQFYLWSCKEVDVFYFVEIGIDI